MGSDNVARIRPEISAIMAPAPLRDKPQWLVWRFEGALDGGKPLKVPYYPLGGRRYGRQGTPEDRDRLTTFAVAKAEAAKRGMDGVGFALLEGTGVCALDFDNCVHDGKIDPDVTAAIGSTYAEYSPSGKGVRAFVRGDLGNRKSHSTAEQFGMETFSTSGFVTITGNALPHIDLIGLEDTVGTVTPALERLCQSRFGSAKPREVDPDDFMAGREPKLGLSEERMRELVERLDPDTGRDEWIRVGMALHHETDGGEEGFQLWDDWSSNGYKYPSEEALRTQWDSFERRRGPLRKQVTMATVIKMANEASPVSADDIVARADELLGSHTQSGGPSTPDDWQGKFHFRSAASVFNAKPVEWLVKGVIPQADIFSIYGASGAGKSFVALDLAAAISRGVPWRGCKTKKKRVAIIAAEGTGGYGHRIAALCNKLGIDRSELDIAVLLAQPNVLDSEDISELVAALKAVGDVGAAIFDTLAQVTPGANENTSEDMGRALSNIRIIRDATGATIGLVHHAGKDLSRGARGWSGLKGAMDAELEVNRDEDTGAREIVVRKQKDGKDGERFGFKLETVTLGFDADGDEITSCVVEHTEAAQKAPVDPAAKKRGHVQQHLIEMMDAFGTDIVVPVEMFIEQCSSRLPPPEEGCRDTRRQSVTRALREMSREKDGPIRLEGNVVVFYQ
jgi:hypothetical protein